jgi:hypothetical protein
MNVEDSEMQVDQDIKDKYFGIHHFNLKGQVNNMSIYKMNLNLDMVAWNLNNDIYLSKKLSKFTKSMSN